MQLSIFDFLEALEPEKQKIKPVIEINPIDSNKRDIELIGNYLTAGELSELRVSFWKVDQIDFYSTLFFYFPKSGVKCEYNLNAEIAKNNRSMSYYLAFRDLKDYLHMRLFKYGISSNINEFKEVKEALKWFDDLEKKIFKKEY